MICKHRSRLALPPSPLTEARRCVAHIIIIHIIHRPCFPLIPVSSDHSAVLHSIIHSSFPPWWDWLRGEFEFHRKSLEIWFGFCSVCGEGELAFLPLSPSLSLSSLFVFQSPEFSLSGLLSTHCHSSQELKISLSPKIFGFAISHCTNSSAVFRVDFNSDFWPYLNYIQYVCLHSPNAAPISFAPKAVLRLSFDLLFIVLF